jgi:hypothetical protein
VKPGDLVKIRKGIQGGGDIGVVIGPMVVNDRHLLPECLDVLFSDSIRQVHPDNLLPVEEEKRSKS